MASQTLDSGRYTWAGCGASASARALNAYGAGPGDKRLISAKGAGLDVADMPDWVRGTDAASARQIKVDVAKIAIARKVLRRGKLAGASTALKTGVKVDGDGIGPIVVAEIGVGKYVCVSGSHRVAALKLDGAKGEIPVRVLRQAAKRTCPKTEESQMAAKSVAAAALSKDGTEAVAQLDWDTLAPTTDDERLGALAAKFMAGAKDGEVPPWAVQRHIWVKAQAVATEVMDVTDPEYWSYVVVAYRKLGGPVVETELVPPVTLAEDVSALAKAKPTPAQVGLGVNAARQAAGGQNPPTWVADEDVWSKAKAAAGKTYEEGQDAYWPAVVAIYEKMGGAVKAKKSLEGADYAAMLKASDADVLDLAFRAGIPVGVAMGILDGTFKPGLDFPVGDLEAAIKSLGKDASAEALDLFAATGITLGVVMGILDGTFEPTPEMASAIAAARGKASLGKAALLPIADRDAAWDGTAADQRVREWASSDGSGDKSKVDFAKYGKAFAVQGEPGAFGTYKLPFADVLDGKLMAVPSGVFAARGSLMGARSGADMAKAKALLQKYVDKLAEEPAEKSVRAAAPVIVPAGLAKQDLGTSANDLQQAICRAACAKYGTSCYVRDVYPEKRIAVLNRYNDMMAGCSAGKLFQVGYEIDDDGIVTLNDDVAEVAETHGYEPVKKSVEFRAIHKGAGLFELAGLNGESEMLAESLAKRDGIGSVEHADGVVRFVASGFAGAAAGAELMVKADGEYVPEQEVAHAVEFLQDGEDLVKAAKKGIVYLKVYGPGEKDSQGEWADEETIADAAHDWLAKHRLIKIQHERLPDDKAEVVESQVLRVDEKFGDKLVKKGSWVIGVRLGKKLQRAFHEGKLTGASMGGTKIAA